MIAACFTVAIKMSHYQCLLKKKKNFNTSKKVGVLILNANELVKSLVHFHVVITYKMQSLNQLRLKKKLFCAM